MAMREGKLRKSGLSAACMWWGFFTLVLLVIVAVVSSLVLLLALAGPEQWSNAVVQAVDTRSAQWHACGVISELEEELEAQAAEANVHSSFLTHSGDGTRYFSLEQLLEATDAWRSAGAQIGANLEGPVLLVVVYAFNRPGTLAKSLAAIVRAAKEAGRRVAVLVSIDGFQREAVRTAIQAAQPLPTRLLVHPVSRALRKRGADKRAAVLDWGVLRLKAHWWWMMDSVFGQDFPGTGTTHETMRAELAPPVRPPVVPVHSPFGEATEVLFLEEDMVLSEDAFVALAELKRLSKADTRNDDLWGVSLSLWGASQLIDNSGAASSSPPDAGLVLRRFGHTSHGYSFGRDTWLRIRRHAEAFWRYRDGWDWSFFHLQQHGLVPPAFHVTALSRLRNVGESGITMTPEAHKASSLGKTPVSVSLDSNACRWVVLDQTTDEAQAPPRTPCRPCFQCEWC